MVILLVLLVSIVFQGLPALNSNFLTAAPGPDPISAGIGPALQGTVWVCTVCAVFCLPLGIGTAIFLEEFQPRNIWLRRLSGLLQLNINNLAGVPSIVYGILGLTAFSMMFGLFGSEADPLFETGASYRRQFITEGGEIVFVPVASRDEVLELTQGIDAIDGNGDPIKLNIIGPDDDFPEDDETLARSVLSDDEGGIIKDYRWYFFRVPFGKSVLAASLTLMLVILPVIIISTQEALRAVPPSLKRAAEGLGCTPWQVIRHVSLPAAVPGIMTGAILAMSRAIGEAAPILMIGVAVYIAQGPAHLMDNFSILPIQIYYWAQQPIDSSADLNFQHIAAGGIVVLLIILFAFNSIAVLIRQLAQKRLT